MVINETHETQSWLLLYNIQEKHPGKNSTKYLAGEG